jgi:hypothetical protein
VNSDLQRHAIRSAFRSGRELQELLLLLAEHAPPEDYQALRLGIADALAAIASGITDKIIESSPAMKSEIDASIKLYGTFL